MKYISYLRVSTAQQGASGLGLDAQRETVGQMLGSVPHAALVEEFIEVESGRRADRPQLAAALARCRLMGATLVVANVSRLTRNPDFMSTVVTAGVEVRFCDLPKVEGPAGKFMLRQMLAVAELEAGLISERTRKALAAARSRGTPLGRPENLTNQEAGRKNGRARRTQIANDRARDLAPVLADLRKSGTTSLRSIAAVLNSRGITAANGGTWSPVQVARVLERLS